MAVQSFTDKEFGEITIHRIKTARHIKIGLHVNGKLRATMPPRAPKLLLRQLVNSSRDSIREMIDNSGNRKIYTNGEAIGKTHSLLFTHGTSLSAKRQKNTIIVTITAGVEQTAPNVQQLARDAIIKALRKEAKNYLPQRLAKIASTHNYSYERVKLTHASTRWGSCSSSGTISLNIALMKLPYELIDYVLIHELCHTRELNHSKNFWQLVERADPEYKTHVAAIKTHSPTI